jgi:hypothetical protein
MVKPGAYRFRQEKDLLWLPLQSVAMYAAPKTKIQPLMFDGSHLFRAAEVRADHRLAQAPNQLCLAQELLPILKATPFQFLQSARR